MAAFPSQTHLPSLDDFVLRSPPPKDCPVAKAQGSNLANVMRKEHSQAQLHPDSLWAL